jgi:hypothetical protein
LEGAVTLVAGARSKSCAFDGCNDMNIAATTVAETMRDLLDINAIILGLKMLVMMKYTQLRTVCPVHNQNLRSNARSGLNFPAPGLRSNIGCMGRRPIESHLRIHVMPALADI